MSFPEGRRYNVLDPATGLVHQAMAYDEEAYGAALTMHATWCDIEVGRGWVQCDGVPLSCLHCVSEAVTAFRIIMRPGLPSSTCMA